MAKISNLVHQTSTTTGTGDFTVAAVNGKRTFNTAFSTGGTNVFYYFISNPSAAEWEVGTGHMSDAATLVRDTVLSSSNANAAVNFSAGTKDVTNDTPADVQISRADLFNYIIDGAFNFWDHATSHTTTGYGSATMWLLNLGSGAAGTMSQQAFTLGQPDVPGEPDYFLRFARGTTGSTASSISQRIEYAKTLNGKKATFAFYAKASLAVDIELSYSQNFGTGGSPSSAVDGSPVTKSLTTSWQQIVTTFDLPSVSAKTLGSGKNDYLALTISLPTAAGNVSVDIAMVRLVEGDVSSPPIVPYRLSEELARAGRYYELHSTVLNGGSVTVPGCNAFIEGAGDITAALSFVYAKHAVPNVTASGTFGASVDGINMSGMTLSPAGPGLFTVSFGTSAAGTGGVGNGAALLVFESTAYIEIDARL